MIIKNAYSNLFILITLFGASTDLHADMGFFAAPETLHFIKIFSISILVIVFGILCFSLFRLNKRLQRTIESRETAELTMTKLSSAVTNSGASIIITDHNGVIEYVNQKFCGLTAFMHHEVIGRPIDILGPKSDISSDDICRLDSGCLKPSWEGEALCARKGQAPYWNAISVSAVLSKTQKITHYVISCIDITALKVANQKMEHLALFDSLTGLANRRLFIDRLKQAIASTERNTTQSALFFLDLDKFKRINDTLGHQAGDELLLIIAERLKCCVRKQDTVARLGGDEFTILLNDIADTDKIANIAKLILHSLKKPIKLGKHDVSVSTSIGITLTPSDSRCSDTLMRNADLALYMAKDKGRDGYYFFTEELNIRAKRLLTIENELRQAIQNNQFTLVFQPQINLKTSEICRVEALIRWNHPERGEVLPSEFISIAEETGLIVPIGEWVLRNACAQIKKLQDITSKEIGVAVNLSPRQFNDPNLIEIVSNALKESGLKPSSLEIEVTETMLMQDIKTVVAQLNNIKATGSTITIDDFGSGYSSLSYLKTLPVDILKVDQDFVKDIPDDLNSMEITSAVIAVAHKLNLKVIAEGVETIDQRDFLVINKCDYAQGYFFSRPLTLQQLEDFFVENDRLYA